MKKVPNAECDMPTTRVFYKPDISSWCKSGDISINFNESFFMWSFFILKKTVFWPVYKFVISGDKT